jgi:predicted AlkP superfamily pyrophosphatase or phosphodiesterase
MRTFLRGVAVACAAFTAGLPAAEAPPKLVVLVVVDQMRADYVQRFRTDWTSGFKRLLDEGAWFRNAAYPYLSTYTCAGHATIGTGAYPHVHGVFQNTLFDRALGALVNCTDDETVARIPYGREGRLRHGPSSLRTPTLGDEMRRTGSRVASMSIKARSAIMLAGHGGDAVTWLSETFDSWETSTAFARAPVPEVAAFIRANPIEADYGKTWTRLLPAPAYPDADNGEGENPPKGWTSTFPHVLKGDAEDTAPDTEFYLQWERSPYADDYLARMAGSLTASMGLGTRAKPDLLAISFSSPDLVGHRFGPDSHEVRDMYAHLDRTLGRLLEGLDRQVGAGQYVVALTADHGVGMVPEQARLAGRDAGRLSTRAIRETVQQKAEAALGRGEYVARVNSSDIYFRPGMFDVLTRSPQALRSVVEAVEALPGVERVFTQDELVNGLSSPDPLLKAAALSYVPGRAGDLVVAQKAGWMFTTDATTHGSATPDDQRVPIILFGRGIRRGRYDGPASPADVAPTLGHLVGIGLEHAEGRVLTEALR